MRTTAAKTGAAVWLAILLVTGRSAAQSEPITDSSAAHAPSSASDAPLAWVRLGGPLGARLEQDLDSVSHDWQPVCAAPCVAHVSTAFDYRIGGGVRKSETFTLRADAGQTESLRVDGGSFPLFLLGIGVMGVGGLTATTGFGFVCAALLSYADFGNRADAPAEAGYGALALGGGLLVLAGGYALMRANQHTSVSQDLASQPPSTGRGPSPFGSAELRVAPLPLPSVFGVPVVSFRF